jgi:hypothetical protein
MDANSEYAHALIDRGPPSIRRTHVPVPNLSRSGCVVSHSENAIPVAKSRCLQQPRGAISLVFRIVPVTPGDCLGIRVGYCAGLEI